MLQSQKARFTGDSLWASQLASLYSVCKVTIGIQTVQGMIIMELNNAHKMISTVVGV